MTETTTFRAAYLPSSDGGGTLLTLPEHATLGQESLLAVAREEMARGGVDGTPEIGMWTGKVGNPADGAPKLSDAFEVGDRR